jgi:hypothetical protein
METLAIGLSAYLFIGLITAITMLINIIESRGWQRLGAGVLITVVWWVFWYRLIKQSRKENDK